MNNDELAKQLHEGQAKHTYFLMLMAASAIAFAVQKTTGRALQWSMIPLGLATLAWAISFFAGSRNRQYFLSNLYANAALLEIQTGEHPEIGAHPQKIEAATAGVMQAMQSNSKLCNFWFKLQFRMLIAGALLFVAWHITEMHALTKQEKAIPNKALEETSDSARSAESEAPQG